MVISFSIKEAREQLLEKEIVYTFRWNRRKFFESNKGTIEYTWFNEHRNQKALGYVWIEEVTRVKMIPELKDYVGQSGFSTIKEWRRAIMSTMKKTDYYFDGWLYKVMLIDTVPKEMQEETS